MGALPIVKLFCVPLASGLDVFGNGGVELCQGTCAWSRCSLAIPGRPLYSYTQNLLSVKEEKYCVKAKETSCTSKAKLHTHSALFSWSQEQFPHQWKYPGVEREMRLTPLAVSISWQKLFVLYSLLYGSWFIFNSGMDVTCFLQERQWKHSVEIISQIIIINNSNA